MTQYFRINASKARVSWRTKSVAKVKVAANPTIIPYGRIRCPFKEPARINGRIGKMHGEATTAIPSVNANNMAMRLAIVALFILYLALC